MGGMGRLKYQSERRGEIESSFASVLLASALNPKPPMEQLNKVAVPGCWNLAKGLDFSCYQQGLRLAPGKISFHGMGTQTY